MTTTDEITTEYYRQHPHRKGHPVNLPDWLPAFLKVVDKKLAKKPKTENEKLRHQLDIQTNHNEILRHGLTTLLTEFNPADYHRGRNS